MKRFNNPGVKAFFITFVILMVIALPFTLISSPKGKNKEETQPESSSTANVELEQTATPVPTATPKPLDFFQARAFSSKKSEYFQMRPITNPDYLITRTLFVAEKNAEQQKNNKPATNATSIYVYIPEATGFQSARVDEAASKQEVDIKLVDAEGNDATGNSEFLVDGGAIVISNMKVDVMYQISVTTDMGTYGAVIQPKE